MGFPRNLKVEWYFCPFWWKIKGFKHSLCIPLTTSKGNEHKYYCSVGKPLDVGQEMLLLEVTSSDQTLSEKDVALLLKLIHPYSTKWYAIGLGLGFTESELTQISSKSLLLMTAPTSYLTELLNQWAQWPTGNHPMKPTLQALCMTLRSSLVGLKSLAKKVEMEMKRSSSTGKEWWWCVVVNSHNNVLLVHAFKFKPWTARRHCQADTVEVCTRM